MEIVIPSEPGMEFDFNSPHPSAPSSPKRFGEFCYSFYTSAPSSPSRISEFYQEFDNLYTTKTKMDGGKEEENEFAFNFSAEMHQSSSQLTAEELFDGGKIRALKPPPRSPKNIIRNVFSPRNKNRANPFPENSEKKIELPERGRQRRNDALSSGSRRAARSLSPYRISEYSRQEQEENKQPINSKPPPPPQLSSTSSSSTKSSSSRKWRFTDFLLFRSASEGRGTDKDPLRKYSGFRRNNEEGSGSGRRKGQVSAHELHYTKNKAASQDLKKKTFLPYKSGILSFRI